MKILFICNKSPYPHSEGGPIAMNRMIEGMIGQGHQVKVLAINSHKYYVQEQDVPEEYRRKTGLELWMLDLRIRPLTAFFNLFSRKSYHVERFISAAFRRKIAEVISREHYDIIQMETLYMAPYIDTIRQISPASKIVLRAHNIEYLIWDRVRQTTTNPLKRFYLKHIVSTLKRYELKAFPAFDAVVAITCHDAGIISSYNPRTIAVPFGIDPEKYPPADPAKAEPLSLFHIGSMNWMPNEEGVRWFLREVWPLVHERHPDLTFYLAGRHMPPWLKQLRTPGVVVVGEVDSAKQFMEAKGIMVVPLLSGSGIRIKIIEGMAHRKPVISTTTGAEGIEVTHNQDIMLADTPQQFADAVDELVQNSAKATRLAVSARRTIESRYNNTALMKELTDFYKKL